MRKTTHPVLLCLVVVCAYAAGRPSELGHAFANPVMLYSQDGKLHVDVVAAPATYAIEGHQFRGMLYNNEYSPRCGACTQATR